MTMMTPVINAPHTVGAALLVMHEGWIRQATAALVPATDLPSDAWRRWGAASVLGDQFGDRFRLEYGFADALEGLVTPRFVASLAAARMDIERTREALMAAARRRDTPVAAAVLGHQLVKGIARWCVELEFATDHVSPADLPAAASRLLADLTAADAPWLQPE